MESNATVADAVIQGAGTRAYQADGLYENLIAQHLSRLSTISADYGLKHSTSVDHQRADSATRAKWTGIFQRYSPRLGDDIALGVGYMVAELVEASLSFVAESTAQYKPMLSGSQAVDGEHKALGEETTNHVKHPDEVYDLPVEENELVDLLERKTSPPPYTERTDDQVNEDTQADAEKLNSPGLAPATEPEVAKATLSSSEPSNLPVTEANLTGKSPSAPSMLPAADSVRDAQSEIETQTPEDNPEALMDDSAALTLATLFLESESRLRVPSPFDLKYWEEDIEELTNMFDPDSKLAGVAAHSACRRISEHRVEWRILARSEDNLLARCADNIATDPESDWDAKYADGLPSVQF